MSGFFFFYTDASRVFVDASGEQMEAPFSPPPGVPCPGLCESACSVAAVSVRWLLG